MKRFQPMLGLIHPSLKHRLVTCAAGDDLLGLFFRTGRFHAEKVGSMHAFTKMLGAGCFQSGLRCFVRFLSAAECAVRRVKGSNRFLGTEANLVQFAFQTCDDVHCFSVCEPHLLLFRFEFTQLRCIGVIDHGVDFVADALLIGSCLTKGLGDCAFHQVVFFHLCSVFLNFSGALDSPSEGDVHFPLCTTDHGATGFNDITTKRDKSCPTHVLASDAHVFDNECVAKHKAYGDIDAGVIIQHFVGEAKNAIFPCGHDGFSSRTGTGEFVQRQEGCSARTVFSQPPNSIGSILVGLHNHRGHTCSDSGGE